MNRHINLALNHVLHSARNAGNFNAIQQCNRLLVSCNVTYIEINVLLHCPDHRFICVKNKTCAIKPFLYGVKTTTNLLFEVLFTNIVLQCENRNELKFF